MIASHFNEPPFLEMLHDIQTFPTFDKPMKLIAKRLEARISGWQLFEDALSNTQGNLIDSAAMLKDVGTDEHSAGIWLQSMITHESLAIKLAENPVLPTPSYPPLLMQGGPISVSHDTFISFVRAYIGVASVLAVYAWADSLGNDACREHTLAILHVWQGVEGYREVSRKHILKCV